MRRLLLMLLAVGSLHCGHSPAPAPASTAAAPAAKAPEYPQPAPPELRLPDTVQPVHYALELTLLPREDTYPGTVTIDVDVRAPVRQVWLHALDVQVTAARVEREGRTLEAKPVTADAGRLGLLLPEELPAGRARLVLTFTGHVERKLSQGLYGETEAGEPYLYTFFEPIDARRAFPCFDEPTFKVPWQLTFTVKAEHVTAANAPVVREEPLPDGLKRVTFAESKPLPSYLVAFMVGPFDVVDAGTVGRTKVPLHFIVPHGRGPETAYAARVTPRIVQVLEDFFDQAYPFEKLDVAVVPRFWGTMEHPGIVALGQPLTLIKPGEETLERRQRYATIAGHELGHYWFGDLVTCRWWNDVWLNESFTSWLDRKTMDGFEPAWGLGREMSAESLSFAMSTDSLVNTPPVRKPVATNDDIIGAFDNGTTYSKGASVLGMLETWLSPEKVRDVMRTHVRTHAWKTATSDDYVTTLSQVAGPEAAQVFKSFVDQAGVPRITAQVQCTPGAPARLQLSQERYWPAGSAGKLGQTWSVPVCVRAGTGAKAERQCTLLTEAQGELALQQPGCPRWVLLNAEGRGYYHAGYARPQLDALLQAPSGALSEDERLALLSDVKAGVARADLRLGEALPAVPATARDPSRLMVQRGMELLEGVRLEQLSAEDRGRYRAWLRQTYAPRARQLGWVARPGEDENVQRLRLMIVPLAAGAGEDPVLSAEATRLAKAWLKDRSAVPEDVGHTALRVAARRGDAALYDTVLAQARSAKDRRERGELLGILGSFRDPTQLARALELVKGTEFDARETVGILQAALGGAESRAQAWAFYQQSFPSLAKRLRSDELGWLIERAGVLCTPEQRAQADALLTPQVKQIEGGPRALARALESIQLCVDAQARNAPSVHEFLGTRARVGASGAR
ncbi:M1 family metallopeptidase [Aggregicoccus sp. 17bor-14]|uniref:M1 family metallopeptidase n=1 Tax=Myxococcaceae TaxID=31 RepID=UPI00129CB2CF|nr:MULTISPECIES: M1 family metallopeptidase [Myxococcaceae]MBF5041076.1 M1 family metallopeptidase [Simulacricoccus sp. 17bor-14]MRI86863.1 M1 family metallopeptidase [Aggregicoccus sp. 17bor-14]